MTRGRHTEHCGGGGRGWAPGHGLRRQGDVVDGAAVAQRGDGADQEDEAGFGSPAAVSLGNIADAPSEPRDIDNGIPRQELMFKSLLQGFEPVGRRIGAAFGVDGPLRLISVRGIDGVWALVRELVFQSIPLQDVAGIRNRGVTILIASRTRPGSKLARMPYATTNNQTF